MQDTDLLLINRSGVDYKSTYKALKTAVLESHIIQSATEPTLATHPGITNGTIWVDTSKSPPAINIWDPAANGGAGGWESTAPKVPPLATSVTLTDVAGGKRFTSTAFPVTLTMGNDGSPVSSKAIKAKVQGDFTVAPTTDLITNVAKVAGDLSTWTAGGSVPQQSSDLTMPIAAGNGVLVSNSGWTEDVATWTPFTPDIKLTSVVFANNQFYGVLPGKLYTSSDGKTWAVKNDLSSLFPNGKYVGVNGQNICIGSGSTHAYSSDGGATFTVGSGTTPARFLYPIPGGFISALDVGKCQRSTDGGRTFTETSTGISGQGSNVYGIVRADGKLLIASAVPCIAAMSSNDGVSWQKLTVPVDAARSHYSGAIHTGGMFIVFDAGIQKIYTSKDGSAWTTYSYTGMTDGYGNICAFGDKIVLVGQKAGVLWARLGSQTLTFASGSGFADFSKGTTYQQSDNTASGSLVSKTSAAPWQMVFGSEATFTVGQRIIATPYLNKGVTMYCALNAAGAVSSLSSTDPGFTAWTPAGTGPYTGTIAFPATFPTGNEPDIDLPAGAKLTVEVEATNSAGKSNATSAPITPA